ncbi:MAG TPA: ABC transporter ATP-binding protein [Ktedonobacterales bacterium]|nr:ABC transporter ATP-binding protein [Ktedonobacterales bacterium]
MAEQAETAKNHMQHESSANSSPTGLEEIAAPYIIAEQVTKNYAIRSHEVPALRSVDLTARRGELVAVRGRSGSGKTTLLNLVGGLDRPTSGRILVDGKNVGEMSEADLVKYRRSTVAFIFQHFALLSVYSAVENVVLPLRIAGQPLAAAQERALHCLELVDLQERVHHRPNELSGGQQQRVAIARALALKPSVILADEPTGNLDLRTGLTIMRLLRSVAQDEKIVILVATHDPAMMDTAHRVVELRDGRMVVEGQRAIH